MIFFKPSPFFLQLKKAPSIARGGGNFVFGAGKLFLRLTGFWAGLLLLLPALARGEDLALKGTSDFANPPALARGEDIKGSLRLRAVWPQIQSAKALPFLAGARLSVNTVFRPGNRLKIPVYALYSHSYGYEGANKKPLQIYPSAAWLPTEDLEFTVGRILYESKFHQIASLNDYGPFWNSFDGVFLKYSLDTVSIKLWTAFLPVEQQLEPALGLKYGAGAFLDLKLMLSYVDEFTVYAAWMGSSFFDSQAEKMSRYGLGLKGEINRIFINYSFVWAGHGQELKFTPEQDMYHFSLTWSAEQFFDSKIFAGWHRDSKEYRPWLYDRHNNAGLLDVFLWRNLSYYFAGGQMSAGDGWALSLFFYNFEPTKAGELSAAWFGRLVETTGRGPSLSGGGQELDLRLKKAIREDFTLELSGGLFSPRLFTADFFNKPFLNNIQLTGLYKF